MEVAMLLARLFLGGGGGTLFLEEIASLFKIHEQKRVNEILLILFIIT